ncbi:mechanosensitive ion channel family protein [Comamonas sp. Y33R10-2]|uniref:mechanosensitive ion channel family protein n=1 Tax=Comamonas sp. Y33R10-2 TaxID=2853257 RepID=UPI001C5C982B|nr:mechanosensitive ion channel domain-containing protein [Comamonas sp. Y33R10-2]QXZ08577.1 mechanosensitive ion channel family protein [Comamonas sp. Y33R10-2]
MQTLAALCALAFIAMLAGWLARLVGLKVFRHMRDTLKARWALVLMHDKVLRRMAKVVPSLIIQFGVVSVPHLEPRWATLITNVAIAFTVYHLTRALCDLLNALNEEHEKDEERKAAAQQHSIKSYVQLGKLLLCSFAAVLIVATLLNRSPLLLLSGLGAMSAVLMLVFKDTILSFVAGVQLGSNDMLRVGDWIEMPQVGADGFVIDIALNTVKVQNFDKTITTIPTWRLMSDSFKNWRGMFESGGRRILRSLHMDAHSIHLLSKDEQHALSDIGLLRDYWNEKTGLRAVDDAQPGTITATSGHMIAPDQVSNLAAFKAYAYAYLLAHPRIHQGPGMFLLARTLEPSPQGVPLQLYCYTKTTIWVEYEAIQGEIFDHLMGMLPRFGLKLYQRSSDYGMHYPIPGPATATSAAMQ